MNHEGKQVDIDLSDQSPEVEMRARAKLGDEDTPNAQSNWKMMENNN